MYTITSEKLPIHIWAEESDLLGYDSAIAQAKNLANHPLAVEHVALMPDFHVGYGMPIGGVFATRGGIVPNAVGVDIGCGMIALETALDAGDFTTATGRETLKRIAAAVRERIPVGNGPGGQHAKPQQLWPGGREAAISHPVLAQLLPTAQRQLGSLGGGNHFLEIDKDESGRVWLMLHSGSRGIGKQVCDYYDDLAKGGKPGLKGGRVVVISHKHEPKPHARADDLCWLDEGTYAYEGYVEAMNWCLRFAEESRSRMLRAMKEAMTAALGDGWGGPDDGEVQTHHNYASAEVFEGRELLIHRKGAVKAVGKVIIPGSMGTASYIGEGLAEPLSFNSCSHGAGRVLGRKEASRVISHEMAVESMKHVVYGVRRGDYDEMPAAYKDIDHVIANQRDLVLPLKRLTPLAVVKG